MPKAMIVYASLTGNTEEIAYSLGKVLRDLEVDVEVEESMQVEVDEFYNFDICVVATYTYGSEGELPDEIVDFYDELAELDLSEKIYGVLGSGQDFYKYFCRAVDFFEDQFKLTKATRGAKSLKFELNAQGEANQKKLRDFATDLVQTYNEKISQ